ncbi:MAG: APC family permease [Sedimentisphaerales bacterium]|nr:APC family permease [Sedimentisphaerales bacterium]
MMSKHRLLKLIHLLSTIWFGLCVVYILILGLRQAGVRWWVIFSLSGHSAVIVFLMVSVYLFAVFKGADRSRKIVHEYPLSSTDYYMFFYGAIPFLGGLAGLSGVIGMRSTTQFFLGISYATLGATFMVWIIIDPLIGIIETLLPDSRRHRRERLALVRAERAEQQQARDRLLADLEIREKTLRSERLAKLKPLSARLLELVRDAGDDYEQKESEAMDIGVKASRIGGLDGMRQLHEMTMEQFKSKQRDIPQVDYIAQWWDGVGGWLGRSLSEKGRLPGD